MLNPFHKPAPHASCLMIAAAIILLGALIRKAYPEAGHWVSLAGIFYLLLTDGKRIGGWARRFRRLIPQEKARVLIFGALLFLAVRGIFGHTIGYFTVLVLLAIDYLLTSREPETNNDPE